MNKTFAISVLALLAFSSCSDVINDAKTAVAVTKEVGKVLSEDEEIVALAKDLSTYGLDELAEDMSLTSKKSGEDGSNTTTNKKVLKGKEWASIDSLVCSINKINSDPNAIYEEVETVTETGETSTESRVKCFRNGKVVRSIINGNSDASYFSRYEKEYYLDGRIYRKTYWQMDEFSEKTKENIYNRNGNLVVSILAKRKPEGEDSEVLTGLNYFLVKQQKNDGVVYSKVSNDTLLIGCDAGFKTSKEAYKFVDKGGDTPMPANVKELQSLLYHVDNKFVKEVKRIK